MDEDAGSMKRIFKNGAGAIVTKSIGLKPREGYQNPTVLELEHGILNAMGLPNPGINDFKNEIIELKKEKIPIIGSVFGKNSEEFVELAKKIFCDIKNSVPAVYDDTAAIGKLYRRQDEIGTPFCVTVDVESLTDAKVTLRHRDSMLQERVSAESIGEILLEKV